MDNQVERVLTEVQASGRRITPERRLLIEIITENAHLDAERIHRLAKERRPQIGLATVYRTLKLLEESDLVRTSILGEGHAHYEIQQDEHIHLVCSVCGAVTDVPAPSGLIRTIESSGFRIERTHLECVGICPSCQRAAGRVD